MALIDEKDRWLNAKGEWIHPEFIKADEKLKDQLVEYILQKVQRHSEALKDDISSHIESYLDILLEKYNINAKDSAKKVILPLKTMQRLKKCKSKWLKN